MNMKTSPNLDSPIAYIALNLLFYLLVGDELEIGTKILEEVVLRLSLRHHLAHADGAIYLSDDQLIEAIFARATLRVTFLHDPGCVAYEISTFLKRK